MAAAPIAEFWQRWRVTEFRLFSSFLGIANS